MKECVRRARGFTIIEIMVVVSILVLLLSISLPHLQRAKYESRMAVCLSNHHQWGNATLAYAGDNREALPRQDESFGTGLNTWDLSNRFPVEMGRYGLNDHRMWDCPVSPLMPRTVTSFEEAKAYFSSSYVSFSIIPYTWWVPRQFGGVMFPSVQVDPTCEPLGWPSHVSSPNATTQPIMSDRLSMPTGYPGTAVNADGGHRWVGGLESTTILFVDGHAERRIVEQIKRRFSGNFQNFY